MIKAQWLHVLKTKKLLISIIGVLFIPVLYSAMFLWAFWDPYKNLEELPVAIVNEDEGAELEGVSLEIGDALVENLIEGQQFKFVEVDAENVEKELEERNYYMAIVIPSNFSEHATTLLDESPEKLTLSYIANEGFNFLGGQIGDTAMERVKAAVNEQVSATYAEKLFDSIVMLGDGFGEAADGAQKLDEGVQKLVDGTDDLKGYLQQLASSTVELSEGTDKLLAGTKTAAVGANELATGVEKIADGSNQLAEGATTAAAGAESLAKGVTDYTNGVDQLAQGANELTAGQQSLASNLAALAAGTDGMDDKIAALAAGSTNVSQGMDTLAKQLEAIIPMLPAENQAALKTALAQLQAGSKQVSGGLSQLAAGTNGLDDKIAALSAGATKLSTGQQQLQAGVERLTANSAQLQQGATSLAAGNATIAANLNQLATGANSAATGASSLAIGLNKLVDGTTTLNNGTTTLAEKSGELAEGGVTLADGTLQVAEGTTTLAQKLDEAAEKVDVNPTEETYEMVGSPVEVDKTSMNKVENYGTGFTPYFMSLGLFVGALLMTIVFPLVEPIIKPTSGWSWFMSKVSVLVVASLIQSAITITIVMLTLGLEVNSLPNFIITTILTSFVFFAVVQVCVTWLGDPGRFLAIIILILQLTTSAGTFPLELLPKALQFFNTLLPMTYTVQAFKAAISMDNASFLWSNWGILAAYTVGCLALTMMYFFKAHKKQQAA